ncbi:MAG: hypothetical protein U1F43_37875 [Myxococcota bacterium]
MLAALRARGGVCGPKTVRGRHVLALLDRLGWERRLDVLGAVPVLSCPDKPDIYWTTPDDMALRPAP